MRSAILSSSLMILTIAATTAGATTWHVPGSASSIQGGINLASAGDTVLVACGTYHEHDVCLKGDIVLASATGGSECVRIEADFLGRVFATCGATGTIILKGFTITEGTVGLFLDHDGLLDVRNCRLNGNGGDGISGIYFPEGRDDLILDSCEVSGNGGDGISLSIWDGEAQNVFYDCQIRGNGGDGVVLGWQGCYPEFHRCEIIDNGGDGVRGWMVSPLFDSCLIAKNDGDGLEFDDSAELTFTGCTVARNGGSGIKLWMEMGYCSADLDRCVVAYNGQYAVDCGTPDSPGSASLVCCDVFGNASGDYVDTWDVPCLAGLSGVDGNIWLDPLFCDAAEGDFRIDCSSPCLNAPGCGLIGALGAGCNSTGVVEGDPIPHFYELSGNWPNPFNPSTSIRFTVSGRAVVDLTLYDTAGRRVAALASGVYEAGEHAISWNGLDDAGRQVPSGTYFARLHAGEYVGVRKMVLMK
jgi:hypothetical protein